MDGQGTAYPSATGLLTEHDPQMMNRDVGWVADPCRAFRNAATVLWEQHRCRHRYLSELERSTPWRWFLSRAFGLPNTAELLSEVHRLAESRNLTIGRKLTDAYKYFYPEEADTFIPNVVDFFSVLRAYEDVSGSGDGEHRAFVAASSTLAY